MLTSVLALGELTESDRAQVGEKAWHLDALAKAGFQVPPGVILPAAELWRAFSEPGRDDPSRARLHAGINNAGRLRSRIWSRHGDELAGWLPKHVGVLAEPFAVRSSSSLEDRPEHSSAGLLTSKLGVSVAELADAVVDVWLSGFSAVVLALYDRVPAGHNSVIVQEQIEPVVAGVCFSVDPRLHQSGELMIECVPGVAAGLLDGTAHGVSYQVGRADRAVRGPDNGPLTAEQARAVAAEVLAVEELFGHPVDVEFAFDDTERPWLVQARPITTRGDIAGTARSSGPVVTIEIDDVAAAAAVATGTLAELLEARTDKRRYVRMAARRRGLRVAGEWFLAPAAGREPDAGWPAAAALTARELSGTDVVEIGLPHGRVRRTRVADVETLLRTSAEPGEPVFLAELHVAQTCGFAAIGADDAMVIEYVPGAAGGLMFGSGPFSRLVIEASGKVIVDEVRAATSVWELDQDSLAIRRVDRSQEPEPLSADNLRELREIVDGMRADFGEVRVEWLRLDDGSVMLWDLSVEEGAPLTVAQDTIVSPGHARGHAVVLTDLSELEAILHDRSVIADRDFFLAQDSDRARQARSRIFQGIERPIVVTPWPKTTLALLLDQVGGFVFDDASLLSHLPIILREQAVPAIRQAEATSTIRTGDLIEIGPAGVRTLR